jgi:hypothetical protein
MGFGTAQGKVVPRVPLRPGEGNKDHLIRFGGLAPLSLDAHELPRGPGHLPARRQPRLTVNIVHTRVNSVARN